MSTPDALRERVLAALPVTHEIYSRVLGLLDIEPTREIPSAAVTLGNRSVLRINPDFVERHCRTDAALAMLVLHELMHVLLGHTRLYPLVGQARNIAFDAVINADLCRLFPSPEHTALFREIYDESRLPEALLRPPRGWSSGRPEWILPGRAGEVHRALYEGEGVTTGELLRLVEEYLAGDEAAGSAPPERRDAPADARPDGSAGPEQEEGDRTAGGNGRAAGDVRPVDPDRLLGNHRDEPGTPPPDVLREIREIVARWPREKLRSGRDLGGAREAHRIRLAPSAPARAVATLRRAILSVAREADALSRARRPGTEERSALLPWRSRRDRRGLVLEAAGREPALWTAPLASRGSTRLSRTHVYVDVSGSMFEVLPLLYRALLPLAPLLEPRVFLFSTVVHEAPLRALRRGDFLSTGGTEIACVTAHALEHRVDGAVIVTDGWVGDVPEEHRARLRRRRLAAVVTASGDPSFARQLNARAFILPPLS